MYSHIAGWGGVFNEARRPLRAQFAKFTMPIVFVFVTENYSRDSVL